MCWDWISNAAVVPLKNNSRVLTNTWLLDTWRKKRMNWRLKWKRPSFYWLQKSGCGDTWSIWKRNSAHGRNQSWEISVWTWGVSKFFGWVSRFDPSSSSCVHDDLIELSTSHCYCCRTLEQFQRVTIIVHWRNWQLKLPPKQGKQALLFNEWMNPTIL